MQTNYEKNITAHQGLSTKKSSEYHQEAHVGPESGSVGFCPEPSLIPHLFTVTFAVSTSALRASVFFICEVGIAMAGLPQLSLI